MYVFMYLFVCLYVYFFLIYLSTTYRTGISSVPPLQVSDAQHSEHPQHYYHDLTRHHAMQNI